MSSTSSTTTVTLLDAIPRPASGDGEISVEADSTIFQFSWTDGELTGIAGGPKPADAAFFEDQVTTDIVTCQKCAYDSDTGHMVCWPVMC